MVPARWTPVLGLALVALTVSGCSGIREDLGLAKKAPDEFTVVQRPPLTMPPDYALRPPRPGERGPQSAEMRDQTRDMLVGARARGGAATAPTQAPLGGQGGGQGGFGSGGFAVAHSLPAPGGSPAQPQYQAQRSYGETALLGRVGTEAVDPGIRQLVDQESTQLAASGDTLAERLMFWRDRPPPGEVVDAPGESRRIRDNMAMGRAPTEGRTPTIERRTQGRGISLF